MFNSRGFLPFTYSVALRLARGDDVDAEDESKYFALQCSVHQLAGKLL